MPWLSLFRKNVAQINIYFRLTHSMSSPLFSSKLCHPPPTQTHFLHLGFVNKLQDGRMMRGGGKKNLQTLTFDLINWLSPTSGLARCWRRGLLRSLFQVVFRWQGWDFQAECIRKWNRKHGLRQSTWIPRILFLTTPLPATQTRGWDWRSSLLSSNATPANRFRPAAWWVSSLPFLEKKPTSGQPLVNPCKEPQNLKGMTSEMATCLQDIF